jgi:hypothetical protein
MTCGLRLLNRSIGARQLHAGQKWNDRPARIDFIRSHAELGIAGEGMVIIVESLATREERQPSNVGGCIVEEPRGRYSL